MNRQTAIWGAAAWVIPFLLFLATLCPTVHLGDSGELNLAAATLGIPHVPGYPLLVQVSHAFCRLPFGNGAMRGNLFSAAFGALACFLLYQLLNWRFKRPLMAFAFAICLAGGFTLWEQSLKIRAYPLNTCFAIATIHLTLLWRESHDRRLLWSIALLFGLGLANHEILLVVLCVPLLAMAVDIRQLRIWQVLAACGFGLLGLTMYAYLPIRALADPVINWGDPSNLERFLDVLLQRQYAGKMLSTDWGPKLAMIGMIFKSFVTEFGPLVPLLAIGGMVVCAKKQPVLLAGLLALVATNIGLRINYIGEHEFHQVLRYMLSSFIVLLFFAAFGADRLLSALEKSSTGMIRAVMALLLVTLAVVPMALHVSKNNLAHHRVGYDYNIAALSFPEPDFALAVGGDNNVFPLWYLQRFERYRSDVIVLPKQGFRAPWLVKEIVPLLPEGMTEPRIRYVDIGLDQKFFSTLDRLNQAGYTLYSLFDTTADIPGAAAMQDLDERFSLSPCGIALRYGPAQPHCDPLSPIWELYDFSLMARPDLYRDFHTTDLLENVSVMLTRRGLALSERQVFPKAIDALQIAAKIVPEDPVPAMNLANTLARAGYPNRALEIYDWLVDRFPEDAIFAHNRDLIVRAQEGREAP